MGRAADIANFAFNQLFRFTQKPAELKFEQLKLVAHRGVHESGLAIENTIQAFDLCVQNNIWGMEFDVRWTSDHIPIVHHDVDLGRLFGRPEVLIANVTFAELRKIEPRIPSLREVIERFQRKSHLMIELKDIVTEAQIKILQVELQALRPSTDFHFLSLKTQNFELLEPHFSKSCFMLVAKFNEDEFTDLAIKQKYGSLSGHFITIKDTHLKKLKTAGVQVGTGFAENLGCLYRECARGVDWHFTNHPLRLLHKFRK